jgi:hypothetical protein
MVHEVDVWSPYKSTGHTTKKEQQGEKYHSQGFAVDLDEERRAPSRSQVAPHGRTYVSLR